MGSRFNTNSETIDSAFDKFNAKAIKVLNQIIEATNCEIVVSSDWRHHCTLEQMQDLYKVRGIIKSPIGFTDYVRSSAQYLEEARCEEIQDWLKLHPEVTNWCAVDDMDLSLKLGPISGNSNGGLENFVRTPYSKEGIKQTGLKEKIIKYLNGK